MFFFLIFKFMCIFLVTLRESTTILTSYPIFVYFKLFFFYTQVEAVAMYVETCVKISDKSDKKWRSYSLYKMSS